MTTRQYATLDGTGKLASAQAPAGSVPVGGIIMWSGTIATIPASYQLCDGTNGTPDLRDKFIVGASADNSGVAKTSVTGSPTASGAAAVSAHTLDTNVAVSGHTLTTNVALNAHTTTAAKFGASTGAPVTGPASHTITQPVVGAHTLTQPVVAAHTSAWPAYYALAYICRMS